MYSIGDFSKINRITTKTLRHYDKIGLLKPDRVDDWTGYRYYSASQLPVIRKILDLKNLGFSLEEIKIILSDENKIYEFFRRREDQLRNEMAETEQKLSEVSLYIREIEGEDKMKEEMTIKKLPHVIVASMRTKVANYDTYFDIVPKMGDYMRKVGAVCREPAYCFTIYHDGEYRESDIDVEICEAVNEKCEESDKVKFKEIEEVSEAACLMHVGPYSTLRTTYNRLFALIDSAGFSVTGNPRESYIDGIWNKEDPAEWRTEVQVPISKKEK